MKLKEKYKCSSHIQKLRNIKNDVYLCYKRNLIMLSKYEISLSLH